MIETRRLKNVVIFFPNNFIMQFCNATFISSISKINVVLVENAEDLDVIMPMYNLLEYSKNYLKTSGSLWNYYRDELTD